VLLGGAHEQHLPQHGSVLRASDEEAQIMTTPLLKLTNVNKSFGPIAWRLVAFPCA
jgi:hypothetical protein